MNILKKPALSIGLPVYNGGDYLKEAVDSILGQSYSDFELIISDNASTDGTEELCRSYEAADRRVRYSRNCRNMGAAYNFNKVYNLSEGRFFKWMANDDVYARDYLSRCMEALASDRGSVLSHTRTRRIDSQGRDLGAYSLDMAVDSHDPVRRFRDLTLKDHACFQIFGVMRSEVLKKTTGFGKYSGADRVLISELSLNGRFSEVPEYLFLRRSHPRESRMLFPDRNARVEWFDPSRAGTIVLSEWRLVKEYMGAIRRSPLTPAQKLSCYIIVMDLARRNLRGLAHDVKSAGFQVISKSNRRRNRP